jgi:3-hydroxyisobutyrate dehydrogenase
VGWIGTGVMGKSMAGHLINNGYQLDIYTRTKAKAEELIAKGAHWKEIKEIA